MTEKFWRRRLRHLTLGAMLSGLVFAGLTWQQDSLGGASFPSGYGLLTLILLLAAFRWRKHCPQLSWLGSSSTWLQWHIYAGWVAFVLFWIHVNFRWPMGILEQCLATVFLWITASGCYGLYLSRTYPKKLTAIGREVIFEQIPVERRRLVLQAEALALDARQQSEILVEFIAQRLLPFLTSRRSVAYFVFPSGKTKRALLAESESLKRYLATDHQTRITPLQRLIQEKDDLDFHGALQGRLKGWLFLHVCLTGVLLGLATVHTILAHVFRGGF